MTKRRTIIRAAHNERPYFLMLRSVAQNTTLSYEALGLLAYLLSKPNDWEVHPDTLSREKCGRDKVYRLLNELKQARHIERSVIKNEKGRIVRIEYVVHENPLPENPDMDNPDTENKHNTEYREVQSKEREIDALSELPDHLSPAQRKILTLPDTTAARPNGDGGTLAYTLIEAYCDAWDVTIPRYREQWHRSQLRGANDMAALGATPEEVKAMVAERREKGKQPDQCPMTWMATDYVGWKSRQSTTPAQADRTAAEKAAAAAELEREREAHRIREGLA